MCYVEQPRDCDGGQRHAARCRPTTDHHEQIGAQRFGYSLSFQLWKTRAIVTVPSSANVCDKVDARSCTTANTSPPHPHIRKCFNFPSRGAVRRLITTNKSVRKDSHIALLFSCRRQGQLFPYHLQQMNVFKVDARSCTTANASLPHPHIRKFFFFF